MAVAIARNTISVPVGSVTLEGALGVPPALKGVVVFAHGSGSSRHSPRNRYVAGFLNEHEFGTLLVDLLTVGEEQVDQYTAHLRFDIDLLAGRLVAITDWLAERPQVCGHAIGYFGASTGAAAALVAAMKRPDVVKAVVSRGGRPDLAGPALSEVRAPTLFIVGSKDPAVLDLNRKAMAKMSGRTKLKIISGATHLFEEPGALEEVARQAEAWFEAHLE
ncbi:MAG TPA: dienelactone hydrolase family protein [Bryobacterales bacterium]|nr:dienelactone hydrolase family protein [Bryobacterales bacterium]